MGSEKEEGGLVETHPPGLPLRCGVTEVKANPVINQSWQPPNPQGGSGCAGGEEKE